MFWFNQESTEYITNLIYQPGVRRAASTMIGFTIVELLIVIVIIAVLAAIVVVAYNGMTQNAKASAVADGFKKFEKSMMLYGAEQGYTTWPDEGDMAGGRLPDMISGVSGFKNYMQQPPNVADIAPTSWRFDYDGDTYSGCSTGAQGANLYIAGFTDTALAERVDKILDDGNLSCGKVRLNGGSNLMYSLSANGSV
jgi:prepilin-type N-terminal cleavage/methylation domain-containing protein